jgi:hypothetical protein
MTLADGTYKLVPELESEQRKTQINLTEVIKDPNKSSKEPETSFTQEGRSWSITPTFKLMQLLFVYGIVH